VGGGSIGKWRGGVITVKALKFEKGWGCINPPSPPQLLW